MDFLFSAQVAPFTAALIGLLLILAIELVGMMLAGVAVLSHAVDSVVDFDFPDAPAFDWLVVRGMPLMVTIATALAAFGGTGMTMQAWAYVGGQELFGLAAAVAVSLVVAIAFIRLLSAVARHYKLTDNTTAVSLDQLVGAKAVVKEGNATLGHSSLAVVRLSGNRFNVMVEPEAEGITFNAEQEVELLSREGTRFKARALAK